jgi:Uncharacterized protein conserved in bacteria (DUF2188)
MPERTVYRVMPQGRRWEVRRGDDVVFAHERKEEAVSRGRSVARDDQPSQLVIHDGRGRIEDESTYQDDPFPPRG